MTGRDFCFWLQGFFELSGEVGMSKQQTDVVKQHLSLVFKHEIDPSMGSAAHQDALNELHKPPAIGGAGPGGMLYRC